jgi:release factor glutamine methyltransferase
MTLTVAAALEASTRTLRAAGVEEARLDAQLLLAWALRGRREDLAREPERALTERESLIFHKAIDLRAKRRPVAYLTGERVFYGRSFKVNRAVLIPRPETELLVARALERLSGTSTPRVADIGTGSGCIAVTLAAENPAAQVWATDISPLALYVARKNVARHGVLPRVTLLEGDLCEPLPNEAFDVIVSNPPYVAVGDLPGLEPEVRDYEPALALVGNAASAGAAGTDLYARLFTGSAGRLAPGGFAIVEIGAGQSDAVCASARAAGLTDLTVIPDYAGVPRVVEARRPG